MVQRRYLILIALAASLLGTGCCCTQLSGRYCDAGCCQPRAARCCCPLCIATRYQMTACCPPPVCAHQTCQPSCPPAFPPQQCPPPECSPQECSPQAGQLADDLDQTVASGESDCTDPCCKPLHCGWLRSWFAGFRHGVPSQQHPDYYSPQPKFHPIPTRPAFEPLSSYPPLLPADPGMNNPLRASGNRYTAPSVR